MAFSRRTRLTLAQLLSLQPHPELRVLLAMHDLEFDENPMALDNLAYLMTDLHDDRLVELITHILQSPSRLRSAVNPKHLYDEAVSQLARNLELDGYATRPEGNHYALVAREPVIAGAASVKH